MGERRKRGELSIRIKDYPKHPALIDHGRIKDSDDFIEFFTFYYYTILNPIRKDIYVRSIFLNFSWPLRKIYVFASSVCRLFGR